MENLSNAIENGIEILNADQNNSASIPEIKKEDAKKIIPQNSEKSKKIIKKSDAKKEDEKEKLSKINFGKFADQIKDIPLHISKERELIYNYPLDIFKNDKNIINSSIGKNWRNKRRSDLERLCNSIFANYKMKDEKNLRIAISNFDKNYKEYYRLNNYNLNSLSSSNNEGKSRNIQIALDIIKEIKGLNKKK